MLERHFKLAEHGTDVAALVRRKVPGAVIIGILVGTALGLPQGLVSFQGIVAPRRTAGSGRQPPEAEPGAPSGHDPHLRESRRHRRADGET